MILWITLGIVYLWSVALLLVFFEGVARVRGADGDIADSGRDPRRTARSRCFDHPPRHAPFTCPRHSDMGALRRARELRPDGLA